MAIAAPVVGSVAVAAPVGTSVTVTLTMTAGDTGWLYFAWGDGTVDPLLATITGGGTWSRRAVSANAGVARYRAELWMTAAQAVTTAAAVTLAWSGAPNCVAAVVASYPGVVSIGNIFVMSSGAASANMTLTAGMQGNDNWLATGFSDWSNVAFTTLTGTQRPNTGVGATGASDIRIVLCDNTVTPAQPLTTSVGTGSVEWNLIGVELWPVAVPRRTDAADFEKPIIADRETNRLAGVG